MVIIYAYSPGGFLDVTVAENIILDEPFLLQGHRSLFR